MKYSIRFGDMRPSLRAKSRQSAEQLVRFTAGQAGHRRLYTRGTDWLEFYPTRDARDLAEGTDDATNAFAVIVVIGAPCRTCGGTGLHTAFSASGGALPDTDCPHCPR